MELCPNTVLCKKRLAEGFPEDFLRLTPYTVLITKRSGLHRGTAGPHRIDEAGLKNPEKNMKRKNVADKLVEAMREAAEIAAGRIEPAKVHHFPVPATPAPINPVKLSK